MFLWPFMVTYAVAEAAIVANICVAIAFARVVGGALSTGPQRVDGFEETRRYGAENYGE